jgi:hypothetical protein
MYQVDTMLHGPATMQHFRNNKALTEKTVDFIRASAPYYIHLKEVKAHTGIPGNRLL